jgi:hypothetical protein
MTCAGLTILPGGRFDVIHLQPFILLHRSTTILLLRDTARLRHLKGIPRDLGFFFFTNTVPVARDMLIAK